jgi:urease accessory protein
VRVDPARAFVRELTGLGSEPVEAEPRATSRIGRDGLLHLRFARRDDRTVLATQRFRSPLQVLEPLDVADDGSALAVLLNPGGGVLGGDHLHTEIELGPGAHVMVATPSATKVYRCPDRPAVVETRVALGEGAALEYLPHHLIPHAGAALEQSLHIDLGPQSRLILYDGLSLGRVARGERWAFHSLASEVRVTSAGRPLYWDRLRLSPHAAAGLGGLGGSEGCAYLGTLLLCGTGPAAWNDVLGAFLDRLARQSAVTGGASLLARHGCVVRFLSPSAHALTAFAREAWGLARRHLLGRPPLDLRLD